MSISTPLQPQVQAIQARIESLAPSATPEDVVMLAKAIEAVGGQANVFDLIATAEAHKSAATTAIADAKTAALAEVMAAGGFTQQLVHDNTAALTQLNPVTLTLIEDHQPLPIQSKRSVFVVCAETASFNRLVLPAAIPSEREVAGTVWLINRLAQPLVVSDATLNALITVPVGGVALLFAEPSGGGHTWSGLLIVNPGSTTNVTIDSQALLVSTIAGYPRVLPMAEGAYLLHFYSGNNHYLYRLARPDGQQLTVVNETILSFPVIAPSDQRFFDMVPLDGVRFLRVWHGSDRTIYGQRVSWTGSAFVADTQAAIASYSSTYYSYSGIALQALSPSSALLLYNTWYSSGSYTINAVRIGITSAGVVSSAQNTSLGSTSDTTNYQHNRFFVDGFGQLAVNPAKSIALFASGQSNVNTEDLRAFNPGNLNSIGTIDYVADQGQHSQSIAVQFLDDTLALITWLETGPSPDVLKWRLVRASTSGAPSLLGTGPLPLLRDVSFTASLRPYEIRVLDGRRVALLVQGHVDQDPRLIFGMVSEDQDVMTWSEWTPIPFPVRMGNPVLSMHFDAGRNELIVAQNNSANSPLVLTVQL